MKAIFLDKDGTLIPDIPYNTDPDKMDLSLNAVDGLKLFIEDGYKLIVVSNQSGIARGYFTEGDFVGVIQQMHKLLAAAGVTLTDFYYCPHHPDGSQEPFNIECNCRKPQPGMLIKAAQEHHLDLNQCWMMGDILNDVEAGNRAGCKTVLIDNGNETEWIKGKYRVPTHQCANINEAALFIHEQNLLNV